MQIFILGTQRSGTQLVRMLLNASNVVSTPPTVHMLERMMPLENHYPSSDSGFTDLVRDTCKLVDLNEPSWEHISYDVTTLLNKTRKKNMLGLMEAFYDLYMETEGSEHWCSKCTGNINYIKEINDFFDEPKFIYVYRDGRDSAVSFKKAPIGEKNIFHIATKWKNDQFLINEYLKEKNNNIFKVSYEELTDNPEAIARNIFGFLGISYHNKVLDFYKGKEAQRAAKSGVIWENLSKPIFSCNSNKFLKELTLEEVRVFESIANEFLDKLGYKLYCRESVYTKKWSSLEIRQFDIDNQQKKERIKSSISSEELERHKWQYEYMECLIKKLKG